jgi:hypothetical protein
MDALLIAIQHGRVDDVKRLIPELHVDAKDEGLFMRSVRWEL